MRPRPSTGEAQAQTVGSGSARRTIIPLAAPGYQVLEVTNLLVPAGTNWSGTPHTLGSFEIPVGSFLIAFDLYLETTAPVGDDQITLSASVPDGSGGSTGAHADVFGATAV
jgi:hypothetical protein